MTRSGLPARQCADRGSISTRRPCHRTNAQSRSMLSAEGISCASAWARAGSPRALTSRSAAESGTNGAGMGRSAAGSPVRGCTESSSAGGIATVSASSRRSARRRLTISGWRSRRSFSGKPRSARATTTSMCRANVACASAGSTGRVWTEMRAESSRARRSFRVVVIRRSYRPAVRSVSSDIVLRGPPSLVIARLNYAYVTPALGRADCMPIEQFSCAHSSAPNPPPRSDHAVDPDPNPDDVHDRRRDCAVPAAVRNESQRARDVERLIVG